MVWPEGWSYRPAWFSTQTYATSGATGPPESDLGLVGTVMFKAPEYASYRYLCRELRLERDLESGDLYHESNALVDKVHIYAPVVWPPHSRVTLPRGNEAEGTVWLPRLDQWLAMLEEAGYADFYLYIRRPGTWSASCGDWCDNPRFEAEGPSREEAVARLWMAVVGREART